MGGKVGRVEKLVGRKPTSQLVLPEARRWHVPGIGPLYVRFVHRPEIPDITIRPKRFLHALADHAGLFPVVPGVGVLHHLRSRSNVFFASTERRHVNDEGNEARIVLLFGIERLFEAFQATQADGSGGADDEQQAHLAGIGVEVGAKTIEVLVVHDVRLRCRIGRP